MTSEQIEIVNNIKFCILNAIDNIELEQMWEMIEKAYEQKEKDHCEDCISRAQAFNKIEEWADGFEDGEYFSGKSVADAIRVCSGIIAELPSVTPSYNSIKTELKPSVDCISRQKLLSRIDAERKHLLDLKMDGAEHIIVHHARRIIEDMPSVTPQQTRWIPVSKELPEENIHVLCQFYMGGMAECYHAHGVWHIVGGYRISCDEVVAWMPLPELYRSESE